MNPACHKYFDIFFTLFNWPCIHCWRLWRPTDCWALPSSCSQPWGPGRATTLLAPLCSYWGWRTGSTAHYTFLRRRGKKYYFSDIEKKPSATLTQRNNSVLIQQRTNTHAHTWPWQPDEGRVDVHTVPLQWDQDLEGAKVLAAQDELTSCRHCGRPLHTAHHAVQHLQHTPTHTSALKNCRPSSFPPKTWRKLTNNARTSDAGVQLWPAGQIWSAVSLFLTRQPILNDCLLVLHSTCTDNTTNARVLCWYFWLIISYDRL